MRFKSLLSFIGASMLAMCINAGVPVPTDTPAFVFKSKAGTMEAESILKTNNDIVVRTT